MDDLLKTRLDELKADPVFKKAAKPAGGYSKNTSVITLSRAKQLACDFFKKAFDEGRRL